MSKHDKRRFITFNFSQPRRRGTYYARPDRVKDPKTAFFYLLDNVTPTLEWD